MKQEIVIPNFSELKLSAGLGTAEPLICLSHPAQINVSVPIHIDLRCEMQIYSNARETNSFLAFSFCCLRFLSGTLYTYFFWPHRNAAEKIVTKFNKGKVRARAESLHVWELGGGNIGLYWQRFRKCWGIIYPRECWQTIKKQTKKQNKPWLHKGMETTPHKVSQKNFPSQHEHQTSSPWFSQDEATAALILWAVNLKYWSNRCSVLGCSQELVHRYCSAGAWDAHGEMPCVSGGDRAAGPLWQSHNTWARVQQVHWEYPGPERSPVITRQSGDRTDPRWRSQGNVKVQPGAVSLSQLQRKIKCFSQSNGQKVSKWKVQMGQHKSYPVFMEIKSRLYSCAIRAAFGRRHPFPSKEGKKL